MNRTECATFSVQRVPEYFVRATIEQHHYLHRYPDPRSLPFAYALAVDGRLLHADGRPLGIVVYKKLQHHKQTGLFGGSGQPTAWQVLDLARVWVHPDLQSVSWTGLDRKRRPVRHTLNVFSRIVSLSLKAVQRDWLTHHPPVYPELAYHVELILSYCDREHHQGTGYRAAGFSLWGETSDGTKDIYLRHLRPPTWICQPSLIPGEQP